MLGSRNVALLFAFSLSSGAHATHDGHTHGDSEHAVWEWAGVFELDAAETYIWSASKGEGGSYADAEMQMLIMPTDHADSHGIEEKEAEAMTLWEASNIAELNSGDTIPVGTSVHLVFNPASWMSTYTITVPQSGAYVFFTQHFPVEFEKEFHYLKNDHGDDIEPGAEEPSGEEEAAVTEHVDRWGLVILGSLVTVLPSLVLVLLAGPALVKLPKDFLPAISCFASGAILAAAVFLMLPEGYLLAGEGKEEVDATWTWGTSLMAGWFFSVCLHCVADVGKARLGGGENQQKEVAADETPVPIVGGLAGIKWPVCLPVLFGDFCHNIVDGFVIGFAAKSCSVSLVTSIIVATVLHELPQEFGDYVVLISKGRVPWVLAAIFNFLSGLSALLGAIIAYETEVSSQTEGLTLAFGGGVYIFVALTELGPAFFLEAENKSIVASLARLGLFALGATLIGLVLLDHEHCIAGGGGEGGGGGHAH
ncbi:Zinc transporter ZIP12 [Amphidinium carterae]